MTVTLKKINYLVEIVSISNLMKLSWNNIKALFSSCLSLPDQIHLNLNTSDPR